MAAVEPVAGDLGGGVAGPVCGVFDDIPAPVYKEEGDSGEQETGYHAHYRLEGKRPTTFTDLFLRS